jgi:RHS repeat-associated protein
MNFRSTQHPLPHETDIAHGPTHELVTSGGQSVTTDIKGNQTVLPASLATQAAQIGFSWDFDNKMKSSDIDANGSADVTFEYDALGRRVARTQGSTAVVYFQADQQTIADYPRGGAASTATYRYVFGSYIDEPVVRKTTGTGGTVLYFHRNQQYSICALTDSSVAVSERYAYTAYGQPTFLNASAMVQTSSAASNRYTYTAREWDSTLGLHHFRARLMSGLTGGFLTRDPIGFDGGAFGSYEYCHTKPHIYMDPFGKQIMPPSIGGSYPIYMPAPHTPPTSPPPPPGFPVIPSMPPSNQPFPVCLALGTCTFMTADVCVPEPTDICVHKWICYTIVTAGVGITIYCMSNQKVMQKEAAEAARLAGIVRG